MNALNPRKCRLSQNWLSIDQPGERVLRLLSTHQTELDLVLAREICHTLALPAEACDWTKPNRKSECIAIINGALVIQRQHAISGHWSYDASFHNRLLSIRKRLQQRHPKSHVEEPENNAAELSSVRGSGTQIVLAGQAKSLSGWQSLSGPAGYLGPSS